MKRSRIMALLALGLASVALGAEKRGNVIDFDADVIQGERRKPEIFIQVGKERTNLESVIYGRNDFNDFATVDRVWRPTYYEVPRASGLREKRK